MDANCCGDDPISHVEVQGEAEAGIDREREDEEIARLAKALGHPARVRILRLLVERNVCVCGEICDELPLAQSTISQHLKVLRSAGLIQGEVDGPRVCYCADPSAIVRLRALLQRLGTPAQAGFSSTDLQETQR